MLNDGSHAIRPICSWSRFRGKMRTNFFGRQRSAIVFNALSILACLRGKIKAISQKAIKGIGVEDSHCPMNDFMSCHRQSYGPHKDRKCSVFIVEWVCISYFISRSLCTLYVYNVIGSLCPKMNTWAPVKKPNKHFAGQCIKTRCPWTFRRFNLAFVSNETAIQCNNTYYVNYERQQTRVTFARLIYQTTFKSG